MHLFKKDATRKAETKEGCFEKASLCSGGRFADCGPAYKPKNSLIPLWTQLQPHVALVLLQYILIRDLGGVIPVHDPGGWPADLGPTADLKVAL